MPLSAQTFVCQLTSSSGIVEPQTVNYPTITNVRRGSRTPVQYSRHQLDACATGAKRKSLEKSQVSRPSGEVRPGMRMEPTSRINPISHRTPRCHCSPPEPFLYMPCRSSSPTFRIYDLIQLALWNVGGSMNHSDSTSKVAKSVSPSTAQHRSVHHCGINTTPRLIFSTDQTLNEAQHSPGLGELSLPPIDLKLSTVLMRVHAPPYHGASLGGSNGCGRWPQPLVHGQPLGRRSSSHPFRPSTGSWSVPKPFNRASYTSPPRESSYPVFQVNFLHNRVDAGT
jgi:hypothetical protein